MSARDEEERHRPRDMPTDVGAQRRQVLAEQRAHHDRQHNQLDSLALFGVAVVVA